MTASNPHNLKVGQELWLVPFPYESGKPRAVAIEKLGTLYATLKGGDQISKKTLVHHKDGWRSCFRCHLSREAWETFEANDQAWAAFCFLIRCRHFRPTGLCAADIDRAAMTLGLGIEFNAELKKVRK
jgi:hypothetical protein